MINKSLIKNRFKKSLKTYNDNAAVQKHMADKLISLLPKKYFDNILEIGCGTGILTEKIKNNITYKTCILNDIIPETEQYIKQILPDSKFIAKDIESFSTEIKFDLIISNACFQWCSNLNSLLKKLISALNKDGYLVFSTFGEKNLTEIKNIFNAGLHYYTLKELKKLAKNYQTAVLSDEIYKLRFQKPVEILRHLKKTGANAVISANFTKSKLKQFENDYKKLYSDNDKIFLTYHPVYAVLQK